MDPAFYLMLIRILRAKSIRIHAAPDPDTALAIYV